MTLFERLSRLTLRQAQKMLGTGGARLLMSGGQRQIAINEQVELSSNVFRLTLPDATVSIVEDGASVDKMRLLCSACHHACEHKGAVLALVLEEKTALGLAGPPPEDQPFLELSESEIVGRELIRREERSRNERFRLKPADPRKIWTDYTVTSRESGKSYRVALRGWERGESFCTCPDFRKNTLGTCKHILYAIAGVKKDFPGWKRTLPFQPVFMAVYLLYGKDIEVCAQIPPDIDAAARKIMAPFANKPIEDLPGLMSAVSRCQANGVEIVMYPDAEEHIALALHRIKLERLVKEIRKAPQKHPLRLSLLKVELLPYQLDGIAFAAGTGRAVLADDMGLGKTIQAIGLAELLARECAINRVLIVCPASVKGQWHSEIGKFSNRVADIVVGSAKERFEQYHRGPFFTICNYEQVLRDLQAIETVPWDLIVLDEGQRIKNWEAKTSRTIKALRSRYALVLSGTPLENRLEELYSVVEFIDDRRLGPDFRFAHRHRLGVDGGRTTGYKNLDALRKLLQPVLLRRTRDMVMKQLPPRTTEIVRIEPAAEQLDIHESNIRIVAQIVRKPFISEMDLLRMQKALLICRMVADSTFLISKKEPSYSTKLERLAELLPQLAAEKDRKVVLFSEWTTMLDQVEKTILAPGNIGFVRLDGSVPQKRRQMLVHRFFNDPACIFFTSTNAGATGLNLQAANTVVNVDLPWNPAILEQRIGRAHRMGQKRPVQVYLMVTTGTIEENMLKTLAAKKELSLAALDVESDVTRVDLTTGIDNLKKRLELLIGPKPEASIDESEQRRVEEESRRLARRRNVEESGGKLFAALFSFAKTLLPETVAPAPTEIERFSAGLKECLETDTDGSTKLTIRLPSEAAFKELAGTLASFAALTQEK